MRGLRDQRDTQRHSGRRRPFLPQQRHPQGRFELRRVVTSPAMLALLPPQQGAVADSFWVSLRYFNLYRMAVAAIFLLLALIVGDSVSLGNHDLVTFIYACIVYLALAVAFHVALR